MRFWRGVVVVVLLLVTLGCQFGARWAPTVTVGETRLLTRSLPQPDQAGQVRAQISLGVGNLVLNGGETEALLEAEFKFNVAEWEPQVEMTVVGDTARLVVRQPEMKNFSLSDNVVNDWTLTLGDKLPVDLTLDLGAGNASMDLRAVPLTALEVKAGTGDLDLALDGSEMFEKARIQAGVGNLTLDLRGAWMSDLDMEIQGGVGNVTIYVPNDVGVRVNVSQGVGRLDAEGLRSVEQAYVNDAYGQSEVTLLITLASGVGEVRIISK